MRQHLLLIMALLFASEALAQKEPPAPEVPFALPTPEGWRTETFTLPPEFAPKLPYRGLEELRFSPGMFKPGSEDFWSYAFVFWLEGEVPFTAEQLNADLKTYFEGLSRAVEEKNTQFDPHAATVTAHLTEAKASQEGQQRFEGKVDAYDPFKTHKPLTLNLRVQVFRCAAQGRTVAFFQASPQPMTHKVWGQLERIREGFRCSKARN
ncbi:MAG: hypothetical protein ACJ8AT_24945 [Hyalangium sp.]